MFLLIPNSTFEVCLVCAAVSCFSTGSMSGDKMSLCRLPVYEDYQILKLNCFSIVIREFGVIFAYSN